MTLQTAQTKKKCSRRQIVAYIEGDLSPREEIVLEKHLAVCRTCAAELNEQKKLLCALDFVLDENEREFELPEDFTKVIVTNAESNVCGLRRPQERFKALFVCSTLFLLVLLGLGEEAGSIVAGSEQFIAQFGAVGGFAFNLMHDLAVGIAVILRSLSHRFIFSSAVSLGVLLIFFILTMLVLSRLFSREYHTQN